MLRGVFHLSGKGIFAAVDILLFAVRFQITLPINASYNGLIISPGKLNVNTNKETFSYLSENYLSITIKIGSVESITATFNVKKI